MNQFKPSILTLSLFAAGLSMATLPSMALAEDQQAAAQTDGKLSKKQKDDKAQQEKAIEAISIKGFRSSVVKSLNTKRYSDTVVDAISADDIGGLPDVSIADSLTRLPGVTSIRIDGQSSELNIRGLAAGFVFSTLNGREQVSAAGGRAVQFDQYPSELIKQAQVYKSQKASLIEGGVAGTIELQTANALDIDKDSVFRFSGHGNWNESAADNKDSSSIGHRLTSSYQTKLLDDTVGISVGVARMFQPTVSSRFVNYKFDVLDNVADAYDGAPATLKVSDGFEINERGGEDTRNAIMTAFNWEPSHDFSLQLDVFYSDFKSQKWDRGIRVAGLKNVLQGNGRSLLTNPIIADGSLIGGTFSRDPNNLEVAPPYKNSLRTMNVQTQADDNSTDSNVLSWGLNGAWDINDDMTLTMDIAHSEAKETYKDRVLRLAAFEDASAATPVIDDNIIMTYQLNGLDNPNIAFNQDFTDINKMMVTSAESYPHIEENSLDALRLDLNLALNNDHFSAIETGVRFSNREFELNRGRFLYGTTDFNMRNGQYITYSGVDEDGNPIETARYAPFQLTQDMVSVSTIGGDLAGMPSFLSVNNDQILDAWIPNVDRTPLRRWDHSWTMSQNNVVEEEVLAAYVQANIDSELFGLPVTGNVGIRVVHSDQQSTGLIFAGTDQGDPIADDRGVISNDWVRGTRGIKYTDYLPSLNLSFALTDDDQLRFAYAKVMSRPDMKTLANSGNFTFVQNNEGYLINLESKTSPKLKPFYAHQIDISYEHYLPDSDGAIVFALWNKDIKNFVDEDGLAIEHFDFAAAGIDVPAPPAGKVYDENGELINWQNGTYTFIRNNPDAGYLRGVELAYTQSFKFLPGFWSGFGANASFSYTETEITEISAVPGEEGKLVPMKGVSPRVFSGTVFYNHDDKFEARLNVRHRAAYRDKQIAKGESEHAYFQKETIWSAQVSYNFTENLQAVVSMDNLTDEPNSSYFGSTTDTGTFQYFGRTLYFGVNYTL